MKCRCIATLFLVVCVSFIGEAQDIITMSDSTTVQAKVIKVGTSEIEYKKFDNPEGPLYVVNKSEVFMINYEGGSKDVFSNVQVEEVVPDTLALVNYARDACGLGATDARKFHGKVGFHVGMGMLFGVFAVIGSAAGEPTPEKGTNTAALSENSDLFKDPAYRRCYRKKAKGSNIGNACLGWLITTVTYLGVKASQ